MADFNTSGAMGGAAAGSKLGPWGAAAGGVLGGFMGRGGNDAAERAAAERLAFQKQMYEQQDPFSAGGNRAQYVPQLNSLMQGGYAGLVNDPMYKGLQDQGTDAVQRAMSARGMGGSGNEMSAILKSNMGIGMDYFNQQYNRLSELSGARSGRTAPMQGMDPSLAYAMGNDEYANKMGSLGQGFGALSSIFGNPTKGPSGYNEAGLSNDVAAYL